MVVAESASRFRFSQQRVATAGLLPGTYRGRYFCSANPELYTQSRTEYRAAWRNRADVAEHSAVLILREPVRELVQELVIDRASAAVLPLAAD